VFETIARSGLGMFVTTVHPSLGCTHMRSSQTKLFVRLVWLVFLWVVPQKESWGWTHNSHTLYCNGHMKEAYLRTLVSALKLGCIWRNLWICHSFYQFPLQNSWGNSFLLQVMLLFNNCKKYHLVQESVIFAFFSHTNHHSS